MSFPGTAKTRALLAAMVLLAPAHTVLSAPAVWTQHNDNARTGDNLSETTLTTANVNQSTFGKLFSETLDDESYSQPLYVPSLTVGGATHNVVYVTTVNNSVYAFDADNGGSALWHVSLTPSGARPPQASDMSALGACSGAYTDFAGKFGIVGTPVIDTSNNTIYLVSRDVNGSTWTQRLHALNITTGAEEFGGPVVISASNNGDSFNPQLNNQRPALTLVNGVVYIGWSSHCDYGAYHGWIIGYNASNLAQTSAWADTSSSGSQGGIWQGGQGVTVDGSNNMYVMTGNGTWDGSKNFGESFVKLTSALGVSDYFTPSNWSSLNGGDTDLGSAGALGIPGTSYVFGGGKQGKVYLVNTGNMGKEGSSDNVVQEFQATFPPSGDTGHIHGGPVYFTNGSTQYVYVWGENDYLRAFQFSGSSFNSTAVATSTAKSPTSGVGMPGGFLAVSANGTSNGIVWALTPYSGDANHGTVSGILHAYNATPSGSTLTELWNSQQNSSRDSYGNYAKFTYPTVSNGKVYVSTFGSAKSGSGGLAAYGILNTTSAPPTPTGVTATAGNAQVALAWSASSGATSYSVYRSTTSGGEGTSPIATGITSTTFTNTGLTNGTTYYYKVAAVNSVGTSAQSSEVSATPTATVTIPSAPSGVTATAGNAQVALAWSASSGATSYNVYRSTTSGGEGTTAIATGIAATTYTNTGLTNGTKYYYKVAAVNSAGTSAQSSEVSATPSASTNYNGTWQLTPESNTALRLDVSGNNTANGTLLEAYTSNGTTAQSFVFSNSGVTPSGDYNFVKSGGAYCVQDSGTASGSSVEIWSCSGSAAQAWAITADTTPAGYYELKPSNATSMCLNATGTTSGSAVTIATCNSGTGQQWSGL